MSSCHGFWSLGGLVGAATGGWLIENLGLFGHAWLVTGIAATGTFLCLNAILEDRIVTEEAVVHKVRLPANPLPYVLGAMALFSMVPEGAVLDWGALYLRQELGAGLDLSGFGYAAFSGAMAIMRFAGDPLRQKFGAVCHHAGLFAGCNNWSAYCRDGTKCNHVATALVLPLLAWEFPIWFRSCFRPPATYRVCRRGSAFRWSPSWAIRAYCLRHLLSASLPNTPDWGRFLRSCRCRCVLFSYCPIWPFMPTRWQMSRIRWSGSAWLNAVHDILAALHYRAIICLSAKG